MPLLVHTVLRSLGVHGFAVQHPRLAERKVRDIDHFLDFAVAFGLDFAHLEADETAECVLVLAQGIADPAHGFATKRSRAAPPGPCGFRGAGDEPVVVVERGRGDARDPLACAGVERVDSRAVRDRHRLVADPGSGVALAKPETLENRLHRHVPP